MKILFMGTPYFAQIVLEKILNNSDFEIVGLFAQPDRPFGRKQELKSPETKEFVIKNKIPIPVFQPEILDKDSFRIISDLKPDIILVVAYGKILPKEILSVANCLNIHASILPKYRGASPIQEMLLNDDDIYGVSLMQMQEGLDNGHILGMSMFKKQEYLDILTLSLKLAQMGGNLAMKVLKRIDILEPLQQIHADASYCKKIAKNEGIVDFKNAKDAYLKSLAYCVWPQIFLHSGLKLFGIKLACEDGEYIEGEILAIEENAILIGCLKGALQIQALQTPGKQKMDAKTYIQGKRLKIGDVLA